MNKPFIIEYRAIQKDLFQDNREWRYIKRVKHEWQAQNFIVNKAYTAPQFEYRFREENATKTI